MVRRQPADIGQSIVLPLPLPPRRGGLEEFLHAEGMYLHLHGLEQGMASAHAQIAHLQDQSLRLGARRKHAPQAKLKRRQKSTLIVPSRCRETVKSERLFRGHDHCTTHENAPLSEHVCQ